MSTRVPRLVVAAPASGQGKTTIAVGLMAALTRRGLAVAPAKVGPDYIDPGFHALATGRPGRNLDPWLTSPELVEPLLLHGFRTPEPADLAMVEGVMGLFDGRIGTDGFSSTAHVARLTRSPVVLVVDISSTSRTVAALVQGLAGFDPAVHVAGVILNKAGSPRHAAEARRAVEGIGVPVLGVLSRHAGLAAPSRHLGLVPAAERLDAASSLDLLAAQIGEHVDLDAVLQVAASAPDLDAEPWTPPVVSRDGAPRVVAVAGGRAFTFRYAETDELLRAAGCEPVVFDPASDTELPPGTSGLYLGGGFPEAHLAALSGNTALLAQVREAIAGGMPTVAECAGLLYLCEQLDGHPLVGAVPARAAMHPRLTLRYATATLPTDGVLGPAGTTVHSHEFHRTRTDPPVLGDGAWSIEGEPEGFSLDPAGTGTPTLHASYLHLHWAGNPSLARHFADAVHAWTPAAVPSGAVLAGGGAVSAGEAGSADRAEDAGAPRERPLDHPLDHHGDAEVRGQGLVDLAVNVRRAEPPAWLQQELVAAIGGLGSYPDPAEARAALAERHGVRPENVLPTSGGAEAFTLVARAIAGRTPLVVHPQFTEPEAALRRAGRVPDHLLLRAGDGFRLDPQAVDARHDLVFVGNPTNPTGVLHRRDDLLALRRQGRTLVVDEAFVDTIPGERESLLSQGSGCADLTGVLVLRSLTKTWALAGLRAGYVVGDAALVAQLAAQQTPWSVSSLAALVMQVTATPDALAEAEAQARAAVADREFLVAGLTALGLAPVPGEAPFVLVQVGTGVRELLRTQGFAVRRGDSFPGLDAGRVRIAVRDRATTTQFLDALAAVLLRHPGPATAVARPFDSVEPMAVVRATASPQQAPDKENHR